MKNIRVILVTALLTISWFTSSNAQSISLSAKGEVKVIPDIASTNINISKTNKDAETLKKEILNLSKDLNSTLLKYKIEKKDIQTSNLQINKEFDWSNGKKIFKGYRASINTSVTFRAIEKLEKIYSELLSNQDITLSGLHYDYSKKEEAENDAYINALENANTLANRLAQKIYPDSKAIIMSISNYGSASKPAPSPMYKTAVLEEVVLSDSNPTIDINQGTITYTKNIIVGYMISQ